MFHFMTIQNHTHMRERMQVSAFDLLGVLSEEVEGKSFP